MALKQALQRIRPAPGSIAAHEQRALPGRDAGDAPPDALYIITMGGNDVRSLAGNNEVPADLANGYVALDRVVD